MEQLINQAMALIESHRTLAGPVVFVLAFAESLAFVSLLVPAWLALVGAGAAIRPGDLDILPLIIGAGLGAAAGDWLSYWIGARFQHGVTRIWPLSRHPGLIPRGEAFVARWGVAAVFIGRFFGPLRAAVPLVAGIFRMPYLRFQIANFTSAFVWAAVLLLFGDAISRVLDRVF
jgi:membrane protein DedA with SNARE-associated domain